MEKNGLIKKMITIPKKEALEISKAVTVAIEEELKARDFYKTNAQTTTDSELKKAFNFLVGEEQEHFNALSKVKEALEGEGKFAVVKDEVLKHLEKPQIYPERGSKKTMEENSEIAVILWAMRAETKARLFYEAQAEKTKIKEVKNFFEILAEFEAEHFQYLDGLFQAWTDTNDFIMG
jgi:rubrerythrin